MKKVRLIADVPEDAVLKVVNLNATQPIDVNFVKEELEAKEPEKPKTKIRVLIVQLPEEVDKHDIDLISFKFLGEIRTAKVLCNTDARSLAYPMKAPHSTYRQTFENTMALAIQPNEDTSGRFPIPDWLKEKISNFNSTKNMIGGKAE